MKVAFILITCLLIWMMRFKTPYRMTYDPTIDDFAYWKYLIPPCAVLGVIFADEFEIFDILWAFSIFLEATTIIPQLLML
jgi:ER lumen protein retaining receptor